MTQRTTYILLLFLLVVALVPATAAASYDLASGAQPVDPEGILRLEQATAGKARVTISGATGAASFVSLPVDENGALLSQGGGGATVEEKTMAFFSEYGGIFGVSDPQAELRLEKKGVDMYGMMHLSYHQSYRGVPVFAADLRVHFDAEEQLTAVNGVFIPDLNLDTRPSVSTAAAETAAVQAVAKTEKMRRDPSDSITGHIVRVPAGTCAGNTGAEPPCIRSGGERSQCTRIRLRRCPHSRFIEQYTGIHGDLFARYLKQH